MSSFLSCVEDGVRYVVTLVFSIRGIGAHSDVYLMLLSSSLEARQSLLRALNDKTSLCDAPAL